MSADVLRRAATELRATVHGAPDLVTDAQFKLAVADWLDCAADQWDRNEGKAPPRFFTSVHRNALAVARAHLGDSA